MRCLWFVCVLLLFSHSFCSPCTNVSNCEDCVGDCSWCFSYDDFNRDTGSMFGLCLPAADYSSGLCFNVSDSKCTCRTGGCLSCLGVEGCLYCGQQSHRGIGFCFNASIADTACADRPKLDLIVVRNCPIVGMAYWTTWVISIFGGIFLALFASFISFLQHRHHKAKAARLVSSLLEVSTASESESDSDFKGFQSSSMNNK